MERTFALSARDASAVYDALEYYAADLVEAFMEDGTPTLDDAAHVRDLAQRLQQWLVASKVALVNEAPASMAS